MQILPLLVKFLLKILSEDNDDDIKEVNMNIFKETISFSEIKSTKKITKKGQSLTIIIICLYIIQLVNTLREILNWNDNDATTLANDKQLQLELFGYIEQGFTRSKKFYSIWQKTIASLKSTQFK